VYVDLPPRLFDFISINGLAATTDSGIPPTPPLVVGGVIAIFESHATSIVLLLDIGGIVVAVMDVGSTDEDGSGLSFGS